MYKNYHYINAGEFEVYKWGHKAQEMIASYLEPNENGFYSMPTDAGAWFTIGTSTGKYGEFAKFENTFFSVNSRGCIYAKVGTEKAEKFVELVKALLEQIAVLRIESLIEVHYSHEDAEDIKEIYYDNESDAFFTQEEYEEGCGFTKVADVNDCNDCVFNLKGIADKMIAHLKHVKELTEKAKKAEEAETESETAEPEKRFEIIKECAQFDHEDEVCEGCTLNADGDHDPEIVESFESLEEAKEAFKNYRTKVIHQKTIINKDIWNVTEFYIEENWYENGELTELGDVYDFSEKEEEI